MSDLDWLERAGIHGADAESALRLLHSKLLAIGKRLSDFDGWQPEQLMRLFGGDAGRAAVVLTRTKTFDA